MPKHTYAFFLYACKADIRNPLWLLAHERSRFAYPAFTYYFSLFILSRKFLYISKQTFLLTGFLFCTENTVSGIAKSRADIGVII